MAQPLSRSSKRRATRKPLLYPELRRWFQPSLTGLARDEIAFLELLGYERWLERGRVTAEMAVALIDDALLYVEAIAEDRLRHPADERKHMIIVLQAMTATSYRDDESALRLLDALVQLDIHVTRNGGPRFTLDRDGVWKPVSEQEEVATFWREIQAAREYRPLITRLRNQMAAELSSERKLELGNGHSIILGERPRHQQVLDQLRRELGERYLAPRASLAYRCARVRKWKQLALEQAAAA
jgi:hypothetical protein